MITRHHTCGDTVSSATYSACTCYRYTLRRTWNTRLPRVAFVMLNPSTATERQNDPSVARCERRAHALGFGAFQVANAFAFRATDPHLMRAQIDPVGPENDAAIAATARWAGRVVCAWGNHGGHGGRGAHVERLLRAIPDAELFHLGLTQSGAPRHPLYIPYARQPVAWHEGAGIAPTAPDEPDR